MRFQLFAKILSLALACCLLASCSVTPRKPATTDGHIQSAQIDGIPNTRFVPSTPEGVQAYLKELRSIVPKREQDNKRASNYLSLSGGGDNGAFGAGLLSGWTVQGTRPEFDQVVGISTGSLIAPFAYLGSAYDKQLEEVFTTVTPKDIYQERNIFSLVFNDAMADNSPLLRLIQKKIDAPIIEQIAVEYEKKGRLLLIGTTNLDTGQLVVWNMGRIAATRTPESTSLFHRVMLASAAVPGVFPPELFDATLGDKEHHELHVDGGLAVQVYLYPAAVSKQALADGIIKPRKREAYIIRNATISVGHADTERSGMDILNRSYKKIIQAQGVGNLYQIYQIANRDKVGFNLAFIGDDFNAAHPSEFDRDYMRALFDYGYIKALHGYPWGKSPPGYDQSTEQDIKAQSRTLPSTTTNQKGNK